MTMALEYPFKLFILIVVIIVIISIMWQFRDWITGICLFPPCEEECNVQPEMATESEFTKEILDKYCSLCWMKNGGGECKGNSICYTLNLEDKKFEPGDWSSEYKYCLVACEKESSSLFVQYLAMEELILITC